MYVVAILLFLLGMFAFGISFSVPGWEPYIFVAGILLVSLALALPIHLRARAR